MTLGNKYKFSLSLYDLKTFFTFYPVSLCQMGSVCNKENGNDIHSILFSSPEPYHLPKKTNEERDIKLNIAQDEYPSSKLLGIRSALEFAFVFIFRFWNIFLYLMRYFEDGNQCKHRTHLCLMFHVHFIHRI